MEAIAFDLRPKGTVPVLCKCGVEIYLDPLSPYLAKGAAAAVCSYCTGDTRICPCQGTAAGDPTMTQTGMDVHGKGNPCPRCKAIDLWIDPMTNFREDIVYMNTEHGAIKLGMANEVMSGIEMVAQLKTLCCGSCDNRITVAVQYPTCPVCDADLSADDTADASQARYGLLNSCAMVLCALGLAACSAILGGPCDQRLDSLNSVTSRRDVAVAAFKDACADRTDTARILRADCEHYPPADNWYRALRCKQAQEFSCSDIPEAKTLSDIIQMISDEERRLNSCQDEHRNQSETTQPVAGLPAGS